MTKVLIFFILLLATSGFGFAGGYSSMANLTEVHSIKIEGNKITIVGSGIVESGVVTTKEHQTESDKSLGQPTQRVYMSVTRGLFVIIPYANQPEILGVPIGGHSSKDDEALSQKWWTEMMNDYKRIKIGDSISIRYQRDKITLTGLRFQSIIGSGGVKIHDQE